MIQRATVQSVIWSAAFVLAATAYAETIVLKSGQKITGRIIEQKDNYLVVEFENVPLTYNLQEIVSIDGKKFVAAPSGNAAKDKDNPLQFFYEKIGSSILSRAAQDALKSEATFPNSPEWFVTYYYRTKNKERFLWILKTFLSDPSKFSQPRDTTIHFFAAVANENRNILDEIDRMRETADANAKTVLERIIQESESFASSASGVANAWAEFRATGREEIVKNIIKELPKEKQMTGIKILLLTNAIRDLEIRDIIKRQIALTDDEAIKEELGEIVDVIEDFVEKSKEAMKRGYNYKKLNQLDQAMFENKAALSYRPDYPVVLNNISNILDEHSEEALLYRQASVYLDPKYDTGYFNIGTVLLQSKAIRTSHFILPQGVGISANKSQLSTCPGQGLSRQGGCFSGHFTLSQISRACPQR